MSVSMRLNHRLNRLNPIETVFFYYFHCSKYMNGASIPNRSR
jgi:hypothetical protein